MMMHPEGTADNGKHHVCKPAVNILANLVDTSLDDMIGAGAKSAAGVPF
jgi:hypothetical protein